MTEPTLEEISDILRDLGMDGIAGAAEAYARGRELHPIRSPEYFAVVRSRYLDPPA